MMKSDNNEKNKNTAPQRNYRKLKDLNLIDDFLFGKLIQESENEELIRDLISILVGHIIPDIVELGKQHAINKDPEKHGIRLDAYAKDSEGKLYNIEVQVEPTDVAKRMRYYQALIDGEQMPSGEFDYSKLPNSIIIFICSFDVYKRGWYQYRFKNLCIDDPSLEIGDGTEKIVLFTKGKNPKGVSKELIEVLKYFTNTTSSQATKSNNPLIKRMNDLVERIKENPKFGGEFMNLQEKLYHVGKENMEIGEKIGFVKGEIQGIKKGKLEEKLEATFNMIKKLNIPLSTAIDVTGLPESEYDKLIEELDKNNIPYKN